MRRPVTTTMTGLTLAVVALGLRAGGSTAVAAPTATAAVGVVPPAAAPAAPSAAPPATSAAPRTATRTAPRTAPRTAARTTVAPARRVTVNGSAVPTPYGDVQVQVTLVGGRISRVRALAYPDSTNTDQEINSYALPQLAAEAVSAQSAQIDSVSGASFTSEGYRQSLQAALDAAAGR